MNESDAQSKFTKWIYDNGYDRTTAWELKFTKGDKALPFSSFQPQQIPSLLKAKKECIYKKLSDADRSLKPFDAFQICYAEAYVVACWWHKGKKIKAYWIDVEKFVEERDRSMRKSLTEFAAKTVACKIIEL